MKKTLFVAAACAGVFASSSTNAAVLQTFLTGGATQTVTNGVDYTLVNTSNDTGDWINTYSTGTAAAPLYYTFTMLVNNNAGETGSGGFYGGLHLYTGNGGGLLVGNEWTNASWGAFNGGGNIALNGTSVITNGSTATFVVKIDQLTNTATVWLNPNFSLTEAGQSAGITTSITGLGTGDTFDNIRLRAGNTPASVTYSNIEFRDDTPFAAVPEPSVALLGGLGALGLLRRRRA